MDCGVSGWALSPLQVSSLAKQPAARRSAAFVPSQPGNFAVISTKSGKQSVSLLATSTWHTSSAHAGRILHASVEFFD
jgi:hypothetical protein